MTAFILWFKDFLAKLFAPVTVPPKQGEVTPIKVTNSEAMFRQAKIKPEHMLAVKQITAKIMAHKDLYVKVEKVTGVPWHTVACIHSLESGLDFGTCLHNGERIIGNGKLTTLVPKGKGPFNTWEEAAIDALGGAGVYKNKVWSIAFTLDFLEKFNGLGYRKKNVPSPYLWSFTDQYQKGKYVADGVYDSNAVSKQCGCVAIMKALGVFESPVLVVG